MKFYQGLWHYQGRTYGTLRAALLAVWPEGEAVTVGELAYSVTEAAKALGVSRSTMYNLIHQEGFPTLVVGGRRLISRELLAEWVRVQAGRAKGAAPVLEHQSGRAEQSLTGPVSASSLHGGRGFVKYESHITRKA